MKILIPGGHLTPALSFIDFVRKHHPKDRIVFAGREFSQDATGQKAVERYEVEKRKIPFISFEAVRLGQSFFQHLYRHLTRFVSSVREAKSILSKHKPDLVLSFGGYVAVPFALAAKSLKIRIVTHEQTLVSGFASKLISLIANAVAVTFPESISPLLAEKTVLTGNPLREGVFKSRHPRPEWLAEKTDKPIVMIMGGNQGSRILNLAIEAALPELLADWTIVHQCGRPTNQQDSREILALAKTRLPAELQQRYYILEWIDDSDLFWLYRQAFCAISRAGANATQELAVSGTPSILVPLPLSRHNEQQKNAQWLAQSGGAMILEQRALSTQTLLESLRKLQTFEKQMRESLAVIKLPENAAERLYTVAADVVLPS